MADGKNRKDILAEKLKLTPLSEEGGYFSETYRSVETIDTERKGKSRNLLTLIYYLIAQDFGGRNYLHQNKSDIAHFFHEGWPIEYTLVSPDGKIEKHILGRDVSKGQEPQLIVKGGYLKAGRVMSELTEYAAFDGETPFGLISEAVAPGFDFNDRFVPDREDVKKMHPDLLKELEEHIAPK